MASKVSATKHKDQRTNIPTEELRDFVKDDEREPKKQLYPRDPSLDPQLVWKGKDEQDAGDLAVDVVPIYIQEKIHPLAIVEDVRASAAKTVEPQADLFADFNGIAFEDYVDFYRHGHKWSNRMILGDSLLVMASLAQKEGLKEKVQMIYMDPPYGIKFGSNWQVSTRKRDVKDGKLNDVTRQPEQIRAFRDTWELGTVESLSPHRVLKEDEERPANEVEGAREADADFVTRILEYLRKSGVQNTVKQERLTFDSLEPYAGEWIQAAGEYRMADGKTQRVAVTIGPQYGTVGPDLMKEAAKEAVRGVGFDLLIVCGFALDPHVAEETRRYGKLTVLTPRMNPDMLMGDGLLKKTGAANLFMVFGEPDLDVKKLADGHLQVELRGLDVYDPTTQEIRNNSTDQVACWFIDTSYNGESFFVRHAYFTGADQPYERLRKALKAEVDEAAWASLYLTISRPFERPKTGKIAVKVINHYGDEVLKVYPV